MIESVVLFNRASSTQPSDRITISVDLEKLCVENLSLVNFADVVLISKDFAIHLGYENKTVAVHGFRKRTRPGFVIPNLPIQLMA